MNNRIFEITNGHKNTSFINIEFLANVSFEDAGTDGKGTHLTRLLLVFPEGMPVTRTIIGKWTEIKEAYRKLVREETMHICFEGTKA